jgi:hypothetical protein
VSVSGQHRADRNISRLAGSLQSSRSRFARQFGLRLPKVAVQSSGPPQLARTRQPLQKIYDQRVGGFGIFIL